MINKPQILFVDDSRTARKMAHRILSEKYRVQICSGGQEAWDLLRTTTSVKIVFTDIQMRGMSGIELLNKIRESSNTRIATIPVIMITGANDTEAAMRDVFEEGATDFIAKPFKTMDLLSRAYSYIKLSDKVSSLEEQLGIDKLSGLYNSTSMKQHASKFLAFAQRHNTPFSMAYIEIIKFDALTEKYGNKIAAQILTTVANKFKTKVRNEDVVARIGTARFAILQPVCSAIRSQASVNRVRGEVQNTIFKLGHETIKLEMAIGLTSSNARNNAQTVEELSGEAMSALETALNGSPDNFALFQRRDTGARSDEQNHILSLTDSLRQIIEGEYDNINEQHICPLAEKMRDFLEHLDNQQKKLQAIDL